MESVSPLPLNGAVFFDVRDARRSLRVSHHDDAGVFVLSLWFDGTCLGTFRLAAAEVPEFLTAFVGPLAEQASVEEERPAG